MNRETIRKSASIVALASLVFGGAALAQSAREVTVTEVVIATSIEGHEPVGTATSFSRGTPLVCFIRASNRTGADTTVNVAWEPAGDGAPARARGGTSLAVPARPMYRTYARTVVDREPGSYRCVVRSSTGNVLGSADFTISG